MKYCNFKTKNVINLSRKYITYLCKTKYIKNKKNYTTFIYFIFNELFDCI